MSDGNVNRIPLVESGKTSLAKLAATGTMWTLMGHGSQQVLRMITQVLITNLLFPEAVGLMALVSVWVRGFQMFTDIGLRVNVIHDKRGAETNFLRTAWTFQLLRGGIIFAFVMATAWPLSLMYGQKALIWLLPFAAVEALFEGAVSTSVLLANRRLQMGRLMILDLGCTLAGSVVAITWAYLHPSVWAYVALPVTRGFARFALSHFFFREPRMGIAMNPVARAAILNLGKWIFLSSILGFVAGNMDRLVLGKYMAIEAFGTFGVASMWARAIVNVLQTVGAKILLPTYTFLSGGQNVSTEFAQKIWRVRIAMLVPSLAATYFFVLFGDHFVQLLYKDDYVDAGWMLQIMAVGAANSAVLATTTPVLLAVGDSFKFMLLLLAGMITMATAMLVGGYFFGTVGLIVGIATVDFLVYPVLAVFTHRYGVWMPKLDLPLFAMTAGIAAIAFYFR